LLLDSAILKFWILAFRVKKSAFLYGFLGEIIDEKASINPVDAAQGR
jgi:hypothetical protein